MTAVFSEPTTGQIRQDLRCAILNLRACQAQIRGYRLHPGLLVGDEWLLPHLERHRDWLRGFFRAWWQRRNDG